MAKLFYPGCKKRCSSRNGLQLGLLFWCIAVQCFIRLPCALSRCHGNEHLSLGVYPEYIKVRYGDPLEIFCVDDNATAEDLEFAIGGIVVSSEKYNDTTRRLYYSQHEKGVYSYYCRNKASNKHCATRVLIDSTPMDVTDFSCMSRDLDVLTCTWTAPKAYSVTNHSLTYFIDGTAVEPCIAEKNGKSRYCSWSPRSNPRYRQMQKEFIFHLETCNVFGCNQQNFTVDHFSIVKPNPPSHIRILNNYSHSVLLRWSIPNNMVDLLPHGIQHRIEYQIAKMDNTTFFHRVDASSLPARNKTYTFLLTNLPYAHMQYEVRIYIRPVEATKEEFWSDFNYIIFHTSSERPQRPPDTIAGAFDQALYDTKRVIYVYWRQLEQYEEAGSNFTYKVAYQGIQGNPKTLLADPKESLNYVIIDDASQDAINVHIWSINENGSSVNNTHLHIPPIKDTQDLKVPSFTKLAYENGTYMLSWVGIENIDNYTLFWCQHSTAKICSEKMNFTVLEPEKTSHVIDLPKDNRYQFAISANHGAKTSGMVWATCDISKDGIPMYGFLLNLKHGIPGKTFVKISWTMGCTLQEGIITGYNITYCPVLNATTDCDTRYENKSYVYISDPKQMETHITDLKPFSTYKFALALNTTYGLKTIENAETVVTTTEDTPTSPRNVTITDVKYDSLVISWDPPLYKNGMIGKYIIYNYLDEFYVVMANKHTEKWSVKLEGLEGFSNYIWSVVACNTGINSCSKKSPVNGIFVRTKMGPPSKLKTPSINVNPDLIKWESPTKSGSSVKYQILRAKDEHAEEIFNTTNLSLALELCEGTVAVEKYQVRAINVDEQGLLEYPGEWSDAVIVVCKKKC